MRFDAANARGFREELAELYARYGMQVASCGCCDPWIEPVASYEKPEDVAREMAAWPDGSREGEPVLRGIKPAGEPCPSP